MTHSCERGGGIAHQLLHLASNVQREEIYGSSSV